MCALPDNSSNCILSIVIPVYRSAEILPHLVEELCAVFEEHPAIWDHFELVLVNDCSPDHSWQTIRKLSEQYGFVKGISLRRNFGQHNATMAGLVSCSGRYIVIMDDDMQHPPQAILDMLEKLQAGYDVCYVRYLDRQHAIWKKLGSWFNDWMATHLLSKPKGLYLSSFKAMKKGIANEVTKYDGSFAYIDGLILDTTQNIATVDITHRSRHVGQGNYNLRRSISLWLRMATSFSIFPLRLASFAGFGLTALSLFMGLFIIVEKLLHPEYPKGWASLIATILFIGGIQTLCIGMIGEYLGRAYLKINGKPQFSIGDSIGYSAKDHDQA